MISAPVTSALSSREQPAEMKSVVTLLLTLMVSTYASTQDSDYYTAAVVEYAAFELQPVTPDEPGVLLKKNALNHMYFMKQAAAKGADIVVFPECGLTGISLPSSRKELRPYLTEIPEPGQANPCADTSLNTSQLLKDLSCSSRRNKIYSVMNLPEVSVCDPKADTNCPSDGIFIYNTNIVFDREGNLIARYRKYNLFVEPGFNTEPTASHSMFDTDFGVRFGMFICFDLLFHDPAVAIVAQHNLTDIVYSAAWFSELPFLTAVQTQAMWAHATNTNLLAAGYNNPKNKNTGSGIYAGNDGAVTSVMAFDETSQMLVAQVKKKSRINKPVVVRDKREDGKVPDSSLAGTTQKTYSYDDTKSFIGYLLQHVRRKGIESASENNKFNNGGRGNVARLDASTDVEDKQVVDGIQTYNTALLNLTYAASIDNHIFLCHLRLCCNFTLSATTTRKQHKATENTVASVPEFYRVAVYDGSRTQNYQTCLVMRCAGPDVRSCKDVDYAALPASSTTFKKVIIEGSFKEGGTIVPEQNLDNKDSFENVRSVDNIIMRNIIQIQNLSRVHLHVHDFSKQNDKDVGKYGYLSLLQDDLSAYNSVLLGKDNLNRKTSICQEKLCCEFYIGMENVNSAMINGSLVSNNGYYFRLGVFNGARTFLRTIKAGIQVCAIFKCTGEDIETCGLLKEHSGNQRRSQEEQGILHVDRNESSNGSSDDKNFIFEKIEIKGNFESGSLVMPTTLTSDLLHFETDKFNLIQSHDYSNNSNQTLVNITTQHRNIDDIFTFGVLARDFRRDNNWHEALSQLLMEIE